MLDDFLSSIKEATFLGKALTTLCCSEDFPSFDVVRVFRNTPDYNISRGQKQKQIMMVPLIDYTEEVRKRALAESDWIKSEGGRSG